MRRTLRTGGLLRLWDVVYNFAPEDAEEKLEAWCATGGDGIIGEWSRAELEEHIRDEHSTFTWFLEQMIDRAGFRGNDQNLWMVLGGGDVKERTFPGMI